MWPFLPRMYNHPEQRIYIVFFVLQFDKMGLHTIRTPETVEKYIDLLIKEGKGRSFSDTMNRIVIERMMNDRKNGKTSQLTYAIHDKRKKDGPGLMEIPVNEVVEIIDTVPENPAADIIESESVKKKSIAPAEVPPKAETGGPFIPPADAAIKTTSPFKSSKTKYPGTQEQYAEALRKGEIIPGMFEPPEA